MVIPVTIFMVVVKHLQRGDAPCPQSLVFCVASLCDGGYVNTPKESLRKKKEKKKIYFFSLESNVLEVIRSKVGLAPVAPVAGKVLEALHFDLLHLECEFLSPQVV